MQTAVAKTIAQDFMRGFFDTIDALLAVGVTATVEEPIAATEANLQEKLTAFPVMMRGTVEDGGTVAVLMTPKDTLYFVSSVMGGEAPAAVDSIPEESMAQVQEVFDSCLGGGCGTLKETAHRELAFKDVVIEQVGADGATALLSEFRNEASLAPFSYFAPSGLKGEGVIVVADTLASLLPDEVLADAVAGGGGPEITNDEIGDILSGFSPEEGGGPTGAGGEGGKAGPSNIDMIMDIRLICTARLGHVEMPIGDILDLGPGSIIEVGHLVDEPIELLVNDKLIARGDVVVVDEKFGLRITEIISPAERIKSLR